MCTKFWSDGDVHKYFSPYDSPYEAYIFYMNVFSDFENKVNKLSAGINSKKKVLKKEKV
jgi:alpha-amylase